MSETTTRQPGPGTGPTVPLHPGEILINLIVTLLTPMFLAAAGGDLAFARVAAAETVESYRVETHADLITVAKIIAFGLAALGSLSLSMADDLPIPLILRLRADANACDRAEHRNRRALKQSRSEQQSASSPPPIPNPDPEQEIDETALTAAAAETQQRTAENPAQVSAFQLAPFPSDLTKTDEERKYQATWAASAARVAAETAASLPNLPPEERRSAAIWIEALNDAADSFLAGDLAPRPRPGDLAAMMRSSDA